MWWSEARRARDARAPQGAPGRAAGLAALALLAAALPAGCGFHLQGRTPLPAAFKVSYVDARDQQSDFVQGLRTALLNAGMQLTGQAPDATAVVHVIDDKVTQRVLSVSPDNLPREYELTYTVRFSVNAAGKDLIEPQEVTATREYSFDVSALLAKDNEEDVLRAALAHDLVDVVMRRLARL
ncbi:MAG TPA: LPS assembly lipoprotein LptE [Steroidobacteraceae bacterium]|nr:LPS assembly lipoprotein LptE [Steroidobacteraceae bacterium]